MLKQDITLTIGIPIQSAILVVDNFSGHVQNMTFWVNVYLNEQAQANGEGFLERREYAFALDTSTDANEIYTQAYTYLKTLDIYKDAVSV